MMKKRIVLDILILYMLFPVAMIYASQMDDMNIHGFISQGYLYSDKNDYLAKTSEGTFQFNEMGINFSTNVLSNLRIGMQLFARDLGDVGNDEITVPWAYADYSWREWLGFRAGFMKPAFGLYGQIWDIDTLRLPILLPSSIYDETARDAESTIKGFGVYGNVFLNSAGILGYQIQYGTYGAGSGVQAAMASRLGSPIDSFTIEEGLVGRLQWVTPLDGFKLVYSYVSVAMNMTTSGAIARYEVPSIDWHVFALDYVIGNFNIGGEYCLKYTESWADIQNPSTGQIIMRRENNYDGGNIFYGLISYRLFDWFQFGGYYSVYENDKDIDDPTNEIKDLCLTLRFDVNENWTIKLEGHNMDGAYDAIVYPEEGETEADDKWNLFAAKCSYNF